jgi:hypothetical protein
MLLQSYFFICSTDRKEIKIILKTDKKSPVRPTFAIFAAK